MTDDAGEVPLRIADHDERDPPGDRDGDNGGAHETADGPMVEFLPDDVPGRRKNGKGADEGEETEPVELLVRLAEEGEIDPWDIDVVRVTDKFLDALDEGDLRASGRALFYASVLLRMKGDDLLTADEPEEPEEEPWEAPMGMGDPEAPVEDPIDQLEREMERRLDRQHARGTPETLDELVRELREAERDSWWKESREYDTSDSPRGFRRGTQTLDYHAGDDFRQEDEPTAGDVTETAHGEDIEAIIDDVRIALTEHYDGGRSEVLYAEIEDAGGSRVETYLALLFLAHRGEVRLQQDELFGDLWVQDPNAATGSGEVAAD
ncbi:MAG: ScpA family protein [Halobacteriales archaeon]